MARRFAAAAPASLLAIMLVLAPAHTSAGSGGSAPAAPARAPVLVELFTSQGCSSCPAADELVRELPRLGFGRDRVVPLTFHVDYWDGLGWRDPFASPAFTARQRRYADAGLPAAPAGDEGISGLYTPQMIVGGRVHLSGGRRELALAEIARAAARPPLAELVAEAVAAPAGDEVTVTARLAQPATPPAGWRVVAALVQDQARTAVARGENAGETLLEADVVRALSAPVALGGTAGPPARVVLRKPAALPWQAAHVVVFVQAGDLQVVAARAVPIASAPRALK